MELRTHELGGGQVVELLGEGIQVASVSDALDLLGEAGGRPVLLREEQLHPDFFRLRTGLAGEILQKFSTYGQRLAVVGDFSKYPSPPLRDFIRESNRGGPVYFLASVEAALAALAGPADRPEGASA